MNMIDTMHYLVQLSFGTTFFLGVFFIFGKLSYTQLIGVLFFILSYVIWHFQLIYTKELFYFPFLFLTYIPPLLFFGPIAHYVMLRYLKLKDFYLMDYVKHFALPIIVTVVCMPTFFMMSDLKLSLINALYYDTPTFRYHLISFMCVGSLIFYIVQLFKYLPSIPSILVKHALFKGLSLLLVFSIIVSGVSFSSVIFHSLTLLFIGNVLFSCLILLAICLHIRFPLFLIDFLNEIRMKAQKKTHLSNVNIHNALNELHRFMKDENAYTNEDLSLSSVATAINLTAHQLSEIINHELGKNFSTYIMEFRINEAIKRLKDNDHKTIVSIAHDVGFSSQSAFYNAFKRVTNKKPSDYR